MATVALTEQNFKETIDSNDMVIVDFWASWCGPCNAFAPTYEAMSEEYPNITFAKVNTEEQKGLAGHFQIRSIPTLMIFREQILIFSQPGALPQDAFKELIQKASDLDMNMVRAEIEKQQAEQASQA